MKNKMDPAVIAEVSHLLSPLACPCSGAYDSRFPNRHYVWVAFLQYENDEYRQEQCARDYMFLPTNWLATKLSSSNIYHCQIMFWRDDLATFETISVDVHRKKVHSFTQKEFRNGWTFYQITVEKWQENAMYFFCREQLNKAVNTAGIYMVPFFPISGQGERWFCAELVVSAFQRAGIFFAEKPAAMFPSTVRDLIKDSGEVVFIECTHPVRYKRSRRALGLDEVSTTAEETGDDNQ